MYRAVALILALILSACRSNPATPGVEILQEGRLGGVRLFQPKGPPQAVVFLFSDREGWQPALDRSATAITGFDAVVVGVDLGQYLENLRRSDDGCHYLLSEIEDLSERLQRRLAFEGYRSPILAGVGMGGTLAYAALTQSPAATVAGALSIDPTAVLATRVPLCPGAPATAEGDGFRYAAPDKPLQGWWRLDSRQATAETFANAAGARATVTTRDGDPQQRLVTAAEAAIRDQIEAEKNSPLAQLPIIEIPSAHPGGLLAVIYSGDGGWRDLDKQIGEELAKRGVPVVGIDCLRYFWRARTPDEVARDLALILQTYSERWNCRKSVLIGYSFGASILPFAYNRLPAEARASVVQLSLLGLEPRASFEIRVAGWLGVVPAEGNPEVLPEVLKIDSVGIQCFYGEDEEEDETLCRSPQLANAEIVRTSGGHHFDGDYLGLARRILNGAKRRSGGRNASMMR